MTPFAVISDVHANLEALEAVLARIDALGIRVIHSLGDVVGYGPDPEACLRIVQQRCSIRLMGNHEHAVVHAAADATFNPAAKSAIGWTRQRVREAGLVDELRRLVPHFQEADRLFVHGTVSNTLSAYLVESDRSGHSKFDEVVESLEEDFVGFRLCFVGHNHLPFLATTEGFLHPHEGRRRFELPPEEKLYVSVGSVGQPRDRDPRACFVTCDGAGVTYHRVAYPVATTAAKIRAAGLPELLAERLSQGR